MAVFNYIRYIVFYKKWIGCFLYSIPSKDLFLFITPQYNAIRQSLPTQALYCSITGMGVSTHPPQSCCSPTRLVFLLNTSCVSAQHEYNMPE